jgi:hypothetical protein
LRNDDDDFIYQTNGLNGYCEGAILARDTDRDDKVDIISVEGYRELKVYFKTSSAMFPHPSQCLVSLIQDSLQVIKNLIGYILKMMITDDFRQNNQATDHGCECLSKSMPVTSMLFSSVIIFSEAWP